MERGLVREELEEGRMASLAPVMIPGVMVRRDVRC